MTIMLPITTAVKKLISTWSMTWSCSSIRRHTSPRITRLVACMIIKSILMPCLRVIIRRCLMNKLKVIMVCTINSTTHHTITRWLLMDCTVPNQCHYLIITITNITTLIWMVVITSSPSRMTSMFITVALAIYTCSTLIAIVAFTRLQHLLIIRLLLAQINTIQAACTFQTCTQKTIITTSRALLGWLPLITTTMTCK